MSLFVTRTITNATASAVIDASIELNVSNLQTAVGALQASTSAIPPTATASTPNTLVLRDSSGGAAFTSVNLSAVPTTATSGVNKSYVDSAISAIPTIVSGDATGNFAANQVNTLANGSILVANLVQLGATQTLTNKTLTTPIISSISNGGILTIPSGADTLATLTYTDFDQQDAHCSQNQYHHKWRYIDLTVLTNSKQ